MRREAEDVGGLILDGKLGRIYGPGERHGAFEPSACCRAGEQCPVPTASLLTYEANLQVDTGLLGPTGRREEVGSTLVDAVRTYEQKRERLPARLRLGDGSRQRANRVPHDCRLDPPSPERARPARRERDDSEAEPGENAEKGASRLPARCGKRRAVDVCKDAAPGETENRHIGEIPHEAGGRQRDAVVHKSGSGPCPANEPTELRDLSG